MAYKKNFEDWFKLTLESVEPKVAIKDETSENTEPAVNTATATAPISAETSTRTDIIKDVDTIMNQLSQLSSTVRETADSIDTFETTEITEELELNEEETLIFDELGETLVKLQDQIDDMLKWKISDPKWISSLKNIQSACNKVDDLIAKADDKLGVIKYNESDIKLNEEELQLLERGGDGPDVGAAAGKVADWIFYAPKYRALQKKINAMKMHSADIEFAKNNLPKGDPKKDSLDAKKTALDAQIKELQNAVNDKAKERGEYIQKVLSAEKIKGQLELIKRTTGQKDLSPEKMADLKQSMSKLQQRYAEEQGALKSLQAKAKSSKPATKSEQPKKDEPKKKDPAKEEPKKEQTTDKKSEIESSIRDYNKNIADERKSLETYKEELKSEKDADKIAKIKDSIRKSNEDIDEMSKEIKKLKAELAKSASPKESLVIAATELGLNELATEISSKVDWQFENKSALYIKYEMQISKAASDQKINESKYSTVSVADKLKMLLG